MPSSTHRPVSDYHNGRFSDELEDDPNVAYSPTASDYLRKRRQRSVSSPEESSSSWSTRSKIPDPFRPPREDDYAAMADGSGRAGAGEDNLTLRRREANRLAAQRFRSRKKGYQDSLEEKVRQLEEDKELLVRRLTDRREDGSVVSPRRKDSTGDADVRVASLEAANRRLQDELRFVHEENDQLHKELDQWKRWDRERRYGGRVSGCYVAELIDQTPPLPFLDMAVSARSLPNFSHGTSLPRDNLPTSPGFRLPPIRLPPLQAGPMSAERQAGSSRSPFLPRPMELDSTLGQSGVSAASGQLGLGGGGYEVDNDRHERGATKL